MTMEANELVDILKERLGEDRFTWEYDREEERLRLEHKKLFQGMEIGLSAIFGKYKQEGEKALDEVIYTIDETFRAMEIEQSEGLKKEAPIYPIIRSTSFPKETKAGVPFITKEHTAETRIYYALDLGKTYRIIDEKVLEQLGLQRDEMMESALFRAQSLPIDYKKDEVAGNYFYFVNHNDGYDATRILNRSFLKEMRERVEGHMTVSVPHQDVLIIGDLRNDTGYDVLAQMAMHFFSVGRVPITSLSFIYDQGKLDPIFIMAKGRDKSKGE